MHTSGLRLVLLCGTCCLLALPPPATARFLQVDPVGYEDQINLYAYARNDPVNASDPTGSRIELSGSEEDRRRFLDLSQRATGIPLSESDGAIVAGPLPEEMGIAGSTFLDAINSEHTIAIDAVRNDASVFGDVFTNNKVDVGDLGSMERRDPTFAAGILTHVIAERQYAADHHGGRQTPETYQSSHRAGLQRENAIMGAESRTTASSYTRDGRSTITFRYHSQGRVVRSIRFTLGGNRTPR